MTKTLALCCTISKRDCLACNVVLNFSHFHCYFIYTTYYWLC